MLQFDSNFYQTARPDVFNAFVAARGSTGQDWPTFALNHFNEFGAFEQSDPSANFDTSFYLAQNPDVAAAGVNAFTHFLEFGAAEGRQPTASTPASDTFDSATYAAANTDLALVTTVETVCSDQSVPTPSEFLYQTTLLSLR